MSKRLTIEEFIERAKEVHGDKYDYSLVDYINSKTKVKIICKEHSVFEQTGASHLNGFGCSWCSGKKKITTKQFIKKCKEVHGDLYDYSLVNYQNNNTKVKIICKEHGVFGQEPRQHTHSKRKQGCPKCGNIKSVSKRTKNTEQFIKESKEVHGNLYDYSLVEYKNSNTKVKIICEKHGMFEQESHSHLRGSGCNNCGGTKILTTEEFTQKARNVHGNKYDYSLVDYVNSTTKVRVICRKHGEFTPVPQNHVNLKSGCPKCYEERRLGSGVGGYSQRLFDDNPELKLERILIYLVEIKGEKERFFKIGLTKHTTQKRLRQNDVYKYKEIFSKRVNFYQGFLLEQAIIDGFTYQSYTPKHKFGGYTECLTLNKSEAMDIIQRIDKLK